LTNTYKEEVELQDRLSKDYENIRYRRPYSRMYHDWTIRKMLSNIDLKRHDRMKILDNGCGIGHLRKILPEKMNYVGLDISQGMLQVARKRSMNVVVGDSQNLCLTDDCLDLIVARSLLHHLPDPEAAIIEMQRVLKRGGEVVFLDTNFSFINNIPRWAVYKGTRFSREHKNLKSRDILQIVGGNFSIKGIEFFGYLAYPLLGFPDLVDFGRWLPLLQIFAPALIKLDELISKVPIVRSLGWGIIIVASLVDQSN
jgi:ubiquinone/menaquinone biosynthesis C-methylase UbiE